MFFHLAAAPPTALFPIMNSISISEQHNSNQQNRFDSATHINQAKTNTNLEAEFKLACEAINNVPRNGPHKLSNELLLKLYGYFKQATIGPCNTPKPSAFKVVDRAKWDAWNSVYNLTKSEAMLNYINEFKRIVHRLPNSEFMQKYHELTRPTNGRANSDLNASSNIINDQLLSDLQELNNVNQNSFKHFKAIQSDDEEDFCDTASEIMQIENSSLIEKEKNKIKLTHNESFNDSNHVDLSKLIHKFGGETNSPSNSNSGYSHQQNPTQSFRQSRPGSSQSVSFNGRQTNQRSSFGAGFNPPPNENLFNSNYLTQDSNRQILLILLRLQQDTNNVIARLSYLEANLISLTNSLHINRMENSIQMNNSHLSSAFSLVNNSKKSRVKYDFRLTSFFCDLFSSIDWKTVTIALLWPVIVRLVFYFFRKIKLFGKLKQMRYEFVSKF